MTLNVVIVGVGNIGSIHASVYRKNPNVKLWPSATLFRKEPIASRHYTTARLSIPFRICWQAAFRLMRPACAQPG